VRPGAARLLVIGVDGLDAGLVQTFEPRGSVTRLLDGMRRGSTFPLRRVEGADPARVWTTIMTGVETANTDGRSSADSWDRRREGAAWLDMPRFLLPLPTEPTEAGKWRGRALWEIVALRKPSAAIGWPDSWPATPFHEDDVAGYLVSDRALSRLLAGEEGEGDTWPASLFPILAGQFQEDQTVLRGEFDAFVSLPDGSEIRAWLWESILIDGYSWRVARKLIRDDTLGAIFVHLPGMDLLRDRLARLESDRELHTLLEIREALECYVRWLESLLGEALLPPPGWNVLLVGDGGRQGAAHTEGFVVVSGRDARPLCVGAPMSTLDVAPMALGLLGFPPSREMTGRRPEHCLRPEAMTQTPVESYGRRSREARPDPERWQSAPEEGPREMRILE
jgi:hypothetical protein